MVIVEVDDLLGLCSCNLVSHLSARKGYAFYTNFFMTSVTISILIFFTRYKCITNFLAMKIILHIVVLRVIHLI